MAERDKLHQMPSSRKMEPSLTMVVVGTDGSSFSLNASMNPFRCGLEHNAGRQLQRTKVCEALSGERCPQLGHSVLSSLAAFLQAVVQQS